MDAYIQTDKNIYRYPIYHKETSYHQALPAKYSVTLNSYTVFTKHV